MKTVSAILNTILQTTTQYQMADLYTFTLNDGSLVRLTDAPADLTLSYVYVFSGSTVRIERSKIRTLIGVEVDELEVTMYPTPTDTVGSNTLLPSLAQGLFDGARLKLERVFMPLLNGGVPSWGDTSAGTVTMFEGRVGDIVLTRTSATLKVRSDLELLNIQMPRNLYQPGCSRSLFDAGCTLNRASYANPGTVLTGSTSLQLVTILSQPPGYFDQGYVVITSGAAAGAHVTIRSWAGGTLTLVVPLIATPAPGDSFTAYPGCDKTLNTCQTKFGNAAHFRGFPYIPPAETAL